MDSNTLLTKAGKKLFEQNLDKYAPADPLYESYVDKRGRQKRRKRELPPGLSARDARILQSVKTRAHYLDKGFRVCGMRFGWTFVIGLVPGAGDVADALLNYLLVLRKARQADLPGWLVRRMFVNNMLSACVGLVPLIGDVFLAQFKANSRNSALLEEFLRIRGEEFLKLKAEGVDVGEAGPAKAKAEGKTGDGAVATKADSEQVKPGAGMEKGEYGLSTAVDGPSPGKKKTFAGWRGKGKNVDKGKFVEEVNSGSGSGSSVSN
jgi:hypothetical protein